MYRHIERFEIFEYQMGCCIVTLKKLAVIAGYLSSLPSLADHSYFSLVVVVGWLVGLPSQSSSHLKVPADHLFFLTSSSSAWPPLPQPAPSPASNTQADRLFQRTLTYLCLTNSGEIFLRRQGGGYSQSWLHWLPQDWSGSLFW